MSRFSVRSVGKILRRARRRSPTREKEKGSPAFSKATLLSIRKLSSSAQDLEFLFGSYMRTIYQGDCFAPLWLSARLRHVDSVCGKLSVALEARGGASLADLPLSRSLPWRL